MKRFSVAALIAVPLAIAAAVYLFFVKRTPAPAINVPHPEISNIVAAPPTSSTSNRRLRDYSVTPRVSKCYMAANSRGFDYPYPVSWEDGGVKVGLAAVSLIKHNSAPAECAKLGEGTFVELVFKISNQNNFPVDYCSINSDLKRLINEEGDLVAADGHTYACGLGANTTVPDAAFTFAVDPADKELIFTTGGNSDIFFSVKLAADGNINIENISAETQG